MREVPLYVGCSGRQYGRVIRDAGIRLTELGWWELSSWVLGLRVEGSTTTTTTTTTTIIIMFQVSNSSSSLLLSSLEMSDTKVYKP